MKAMRVAGLATMLLTSVLGLGSVRGQSVTVNGAGATFPYPIYSVWAFEYAKIGGMRLNYQAIGSGGGIKQIQARTVDFGASDAPMKIDELNTNGLAQFPMVMGGVVPIVNVQGVQPGQLKLTPAVLAGIFLGRIGNWSDTQIQDLNPEVKLPDQAITVVHRSDGSGTTWIFTNYLSKVSSTWAVKVGTEKAVSWPTGVGAEGNPGVANYVARVNGAIGYVEFAYAVENKLSHTQLQNREGVFVQPTMESFTAAAANADWKSAPGYYVVLTNQPGKESWPITGASFILVPKEMKNAQTAKAMLKFFDWCFRSGAEAAMQKNYVPIPENVYNLVEETWKKDLKAGGQPVWP